MAHKASFYAFPIVREKGDQEDYVAKMHTCLRDGKSCGEDQVYLK